MTVHCEIRLVLLAGFYLLLLLFGWIAQFRRFCQGLKEAWYLSSYCIRWCCLFLVSWRSFPFLHSSGTFVVCQHMLNRFVISYTILIASCFTSSSEIWSSPAALLFFSSFIAFLISVSVIIPRLASISLVIVEALKSKVVVGFGWFSVSLKYSIQRVSCSSFF